MVPKVCICGTGRKKAAHMIYKRAGSGKGEELPCPANGRSSRLTPAVLEGDTHTHTHTHRQSRRLLPQGSRRAMLEGTGCTSSHSCA